MRFRAQPLMYPMPNLCTLSVGAPAMLAVLYACCSEPLRLSLTQLPWALACLMGLA